VHHREGRDGCGGGREVNEYTILAELEILTHRLEDAGVIRPMIALNCTCGAVPVITEKPEGRSIGCENCPAHTLSCGDDVSLNRLIFEWNRRTQARHRKSLVLPDR
jgi:hypothetical protein